MRKESNHPASGNGAIASLFHIASLVRAVPEPVRWLEATSPDSITDSRLK